MGEIIGNVFKSNTTGEFKVISFHHYDNKNRYYEVEFLETGYKTVARKCNILAGKLKDPYYKSVLGVACKGNIMTTGKYQRFYNIWKHMIERCYSQKDKWFKNYGGKGVQVSSDWLCFENFYKDVINLEGYNDKLFYEGKIDLDKDFKQKGIPTENMVYSKDTCMWVCTKINRGYTPTKRNSFQAKSPNGEIYISDSQTNFAKEHGLKVSSISACLHGLRKSLYGWKFEFIQD